MPHKPSKINGLGQIWTKCSQSGPKSTPYCRYTGTRYDYFVPQGHGRYGWRKGAVSRSGLSAGPFTGSSAPAGGCFPSRQPEVPVPHLGHRGVHRLRRVKGGAASATSPEGSRGQLQRRALAPSASGTGTGSRSFASTDARVEIAQVQRFADRHSEGGGRREQSD